MQQHPTSNIRHPTSKDTHAGVLVGAGCEDGRGPTSDFRPLTSGARGL